MKKLTYILLGTILLLHACSGIRTSKSEKEFLFKLEEEPVSIEEFLYVYQKNNFNRDSTDLRKDINDYLDLYINFKLKVKEAKDMGLQNSESFIEEFNTYKDQLAKPFLTENKVTDSLVREAYERMKNEVRAQHILIEVDQYAEAEDTLEAYRKISDIRQKALAGEDFSILARKHSEDPSAAGNSGDLGYFTALQMVYPFENAAYNTRVGAISEPIRTRFGYHLVKVTDRRKSLGQVKVSHIMIRATEGMQRQDTLAAIQKINAIAQKLKQGEDWFELVSQYSEDISSKSNGGALPWFSMGNMIPSFADASFALKEKGAISRPVRTPYGWHIIRLEDRKTLDPFDVVKDDIEQKVRKDSRSEINQKMLLERLKRENNFKDQEKIAQLGFNLADSSLLTGNWTFDPQQQNLNTPMFSIGNKEYLLHNFFEYLSDKDKAVSGVSPRQYMKMQYEQFQEESLLNYEKEHLAEKYMEYRLLEQEYRDGILLFQLMDEKVWSKAVADSSGLNQYYLQNQENYQWEERAEALIIQTEDQKLLDEVKYWLSKPMFPVATDTVTIQEMTEDITLEQLKGKTSLLISDLALNPNLVLQLQFRNDTLLSQYRKFFRDYTSEARIEAGRFELKVNENGPDFAAFLLSSSPKSLEQFFNQKSALAVKIDEGLYEKGQHKILDQSTWKPGEYTFKTNGKLYLVVIQSILPPAFKKLSEIRGLVISDYQNYLEKKWVQELRSKYEVHLNQKALEKLFRRMENS
jgi:peptidyl-prolyl cis-trans isomerase SurA